MPHGRWIGGLLLMVAAFAGQGAERILSLCSAATDALVAAGYENCLVLVDQHAKILLDDPEDPRILPPGELSLELVAASEIDLAVVWWYQTETLEALRRIGVPVLAAKSPNLAQLPEFWRALESAAAVDLSALHEQFKALPSVPESSGIRVYWELYAPGATGGKGSYLGDLLLHAGLDNIARDRDGYPVLKDEAIVAADPEVIFLPEGTDVAAWCRRPGFGATAAVRNRRVFCVPRKWLIAGVGFADAVKYLQKVTEDAFL